MIPGVTNLLERSTTVAPAGGCTDGPISRMRPSSITMVTPACAGDPVPSMTVALVSAIGCAAAAPIARAPATPAIKIARIGLLQLRGEKRKALVAESLPAAGPIWPLRPAASQ